MRHLGSNCGTSIHHVAEHRVMHTSQILASRAAIASGSQHNDGGLPVMSLGAPAAAAAGGLIRISGSQIVARGFPVSAIEGFDGHRFDGAAVDAAGVDAHAVGMRPRNVKGLDAAMRAEVVLR